VSAEDRPNEIVAELKKAAVLMGIFDSEVSWKMNKHTERLEISFMAGKREIMADFHKMEVPFLLQGDIAEMILRTWITEILVEVRSK